MHVSTLQLPERDGPSYALGGFKAITPAERQLRRTVPRGLESLLTAGWVPSSPRSERPTAANLGLSRPMRCGKDESSAAGIPAADVPFESELEFEPLHPEQREPD